ncbi:unnamed protein product [Lymnaea stagnalis]|uniref:Lebercilin domain-containing protein n=1 Tax=Lymnaea stagnalis TaxID=6523 RepID=A0AAV2I178_LYMST
MSVDRAYSERDDRASERNADKYSDDFSSDDDQRTPTPHKSSTQKNTHHQYYQDRFRGKGRGAGGGARGRGRGTKRGRGSSRASEPGDMRKSHDTITARVLSASRNRINELRNKVEELRIQIKDLEQENRLYKKMQFRQEKAIRVIEEKENDLPSILDKHNNEVRALREQNRKMKEKYDKSDRYLRDAEDELERVKKKMNKYKEMCEQKELMERDELTRKLTKAELDLEEKEAKIRELQRHVETLKKNHRHELGIEAARQKDMKKQVEELTEKNSQLESLLKDKEKALEHKNIYSRPPRSRDDSPDESPNRKPKKKTSSMTELTPRDKAKFYADKRREELQKQKEIKAEQERKKRRLWEDEKKEEKKEKEKNYSSPPEFSFNTVDKDIEEREENSRQEKEEKLWRDRENREKQAKEEIERKRHDLEKRQNQENKLKREREEKDQHEREDRERGEKEEKEQRDREEKLRKEKERKEREEWEREKKDREKKEAEKAELERKAQLEREKLENDPIYLEERRKKDELLRKLNAMDGVGSGEPDPFKPTSPSKKSKESSRAGGFGDGMDSPSKRSDPKEYSFTKPINNLHQGKPAHEDVSVPYLERQRQKRQVSNDSLGAGYQPSFGPPKVGNGIKNNNKPKSIFDDDDALAFKPVTDHSSSKSTTKTDKQSTNLLENLFGPQAATNKKATNKKADEDSFFLTDHSLSPGEKRGGTSSNTVTTFPWDSTTSNTKGNKSNNESERGTTLFGGGAALVDDDVSAPNKVLPRRQRQANINTFTAKPTVNAVSSFDDEIEEVVI